LRNPYLSKDDGLFFSSKAPGLVFSATYPRGSFAPSAFPSTSSGLRVPPIDTLRKDSIPPPVTSKKSIVFLGMVKITTFFNPDYAVGIVTRVEKPQRNEKLERFCAEGILVHMLRSVIVKRSLQQSFSGRSRWLLHNLGSKVSLGGYCWKRGVVRMIHYQAWKSDQVWCFFFFQGLNMEINTVIMRTAH
jgi:hypothetical protein